MTIIKDTEDCKKLLEENGIKGWKRTSKCKKYGFEIRNFETNKGNYAIVVTDLSTNELLAHSIQTPIDIIGPYEELYDKWNNAYRKNFTKEEEDFYNKSKPELDKIPTNQLIFSIEPYLGYADDDSISIMTNPFYYVLNDDGYWYDQHFDVVENDFPKYMDGFGVSECCHTANLTVDYPKIFLDFINMGMMWHPNYNFFEDEEE